MQDNEIIALFLQRDEKALSELCSKYGKNLLGIALNMLSSKEDAEECVNDAYLAVWNKIPPEKPRSLGAFLCRIARNISVSRLRLTIHLTVKTKPKPFSKNLSAPNTP